MGYESPMPVQEEVIPFLLGEDNDVIALAQTGTGKTAAYGLPILQKINVSQYQPQALILCPTRELCLQIADDLNDYSSAVTAHGCIGNYGQLIGHGTLRGAVMGFVDRDPTPEEMERLKALLRRELEAGAFGMSLGLIYPPSSFCKTEELVELAKVLKEYDALLTVHMRSEGPRVFQAVDEMLEITRRSGVHLQISHLKLMGKPQWGRADELLAKRD